MASVKRTLGNTSSLLEIVIHELTAEEGDIELKGPPPKKVLGATLRESHPTKTVLAVQAPGIIHVFFETMDP